MIRVRFHARGGHGVKTASRILGTAAFLEGLYAQDSPVYGAERRGAAVVAFTRIDRQPVQDRGAIRRPDLIVIGDETLLADPAAGVLAGQESAWTVFVNCAEANGLAERFGIRPPLVAADITTTTAEVLGRASALSAGLGAAAARLTGAISTASLEAAVRQELGEKGLPSELLERNVEIAKAVYGELEPPDPTSVATIPAGAETQSENGVVVPIAWQELERAAPVIRRPGSSLARHTGSWRLERPEVNVDECVACSLCFVRCPDGALALDESGYPIIDYEHCKGCMICQATCPTGAIESRREVRSW